MNLMASASIALVKIVSASIPLFAVAISYFFGLNTQAHQRKYDVLRERYQKLYVPHFNLLLITPPEDILPSELSLSARGKYLDLISSHTHLLGSKSAEIFPKFFRAFMDLLELEDDNTDFEDADTEYDDAFITMEDILLQEGSKLAKQLKYPDLAKTISTIRDKRLRE